MHWPARETSSEVAPARTWIQNHPRHPRTVGMVFAAVERFAGGGEQHERIWRPR